MSIAFPYWELLYINSIFRCVDYAERGRLFVFGHGVTRFGAAAPVGQKHRKPEAGCLMSEVREQDNCLKSET
jgi:hypothetical protein